MSKETIRKGARVLVIAGNERGKTGEVLTRGKDTVLVQGINMRKKHLKRTQETQGGRIIDMEVPIHISNVCLCDKDGNRLKKNAKVASQKETAPKKEATSKKKEAAPNKPAKEKTAPKKKAAKTAAKSSAKKVKDV